MNATSPRVTRAVSCRLGPVRLAVVAYATATAIASLGCSSGVRVDREIPSGDAAPASAGPAARWSTDETLAFLYAGEPSTWPTPVLGAEAMWQEFGPVPPVAHPAANPHSQVKEELGRLLFHDGRLSGTGQMSCASCHAPELGWTDGRATSLGHGAEPVSRNAPTVLNSGHLAELFWDGRASSLEELVQRVLHNPTEMRIDAGQLVAGLATSAEYRARFQQAFGDPEPSLRRVVEAIACFVRTVVSDGSSPFDDFLRGERDALSPAALRGLHLFRTRARCANCHNGPLLSDGQFHDLGLSYYGRKLEDLGRYDTTGATADVGRFKTPSLRNVARTGPYMHNGLFDLPGVLNMYAAGMVTLRRNPEQADDPLFPTKSPLLAPVDLSEDDKQDLTQFLDSLTERRRRVRVALPKFAEGPPAADAAGATGAVDDVHKRGAMDEDAGR